jgi:hypothetical protein
MKMEKIRVLAVDPSLRNTGLAIITYDAETNTFLPPHHCQVLVNPQKYKGTDAILSMLDLINEISAEYSEQSDVVLVESPPIMFNKLWSGGAIAAIAHISGGAVAFLGIDKSHLFRPNEWNRCRKKEVTHAKTIAVLGHPDTWSYSVRVKSEKRIEHILDAASMALWWIKSNYMEE